MITKIQKWGNSLGLRIPRSFAQEARVDSGSPVNLSIKQGKLVISPLKTKRYDLGSLVRKINRKNLHGEVKFGKPQGRELL